ncbi:hypothetical protein Tco_1111305, partial [Tanacetum coccineum]
QSQPLKILGKGEGLPTWLLYSWGESGRVGEMILARERSGFAGEKYDPTLYMLLGLSARTQAKPTESISVVKGSFAISVEPLIWVIGIRSDTGIELTRIFRSDYAGCNETPSEYFRVAKSGYWST